MVTEISINKNSLEMANVSNDAITLIIIEEVFLEFKFATKEHCSLRLLKMEPRMKFSGPLCGIRVTV